MHCKKAFQHGDTEDTEKNKSGVYLCSHNGGAGVQQSAAGLAGIIRRRSVARRLHRRAGEVDATNMSYWTLAFFDFDTNEREFHEKE